MEDAYKMTSPNEYNKNVKPRRGNFPNFLCVGAVKSGTTTLSAMMRLHPDVFVPHIKEINYFNQDNYTYDNYAKYSVHFKNSEQYKICAEFTPMYLCNDDAPDRILNLLGADIKIIILLRNPVDRAFSEHQMILLSNPQALSFEESFVKWSDLRNLDCSTNCFGNNFGRSLYFEQVRIYLEKFNHVKVVLFEDFIQYSERETEDICEFLEIEKCTIPMEKGNPQRVAKSVRLNYYMKKLMRILIKNNTRKLQ